MSLPLQGGWACGFSKRGKGKGPATKSRLGLKRLREIFPGVGGGRIPYTKKEKRTSFGRGIMGGEERVRFLRNTSPIEEEGLYP